MGSNPASTANAKVLADVEDAKASIANLSTEAQQKIKAFWADLEAAEQADLAGVKAVLGL